LDDPGGTGASRGQSSQVLLGSEKGLPERSWSHIVATNDFSEVGEGQPGDMPEFFDPAQSQLLNCTASWSVPRPTSFDILSFLKYY